MCLGAIGERVEAVLAWCPARRRAPGGAYCPVPRAVWMLASSLASPSSIVASPSSHRHRRVARPPGPP